MTWHGPGYPIKKPEQKAAESDRTPAQVREDAALESIKRTQELNRRIQEMGAGIKSKPVSSSEFDEALRRAARFYNSNKYGSKICFKEGAKWARAIDADEIKHHYEAVVRASGKILTHELTIDSLTEENQRLLKSVEMWKFRSDKMGNLAELRNERIEKLTAALKRIADNAKPTGLGWNFTYKELSKIAREAIAADEKEG